MQTINCPHCRKPLEDSGDLAGWEVACPSCGCRFRMPTAFDLSFGAQRVSGRLRRRRSSSLLLTPGAFICAVIFIAVVVVLGVMIVDATREQRARRIMDEATKQVDKIISLPDDLD